MKLSVRYGLQQFIFFAAGAAFFCYAVSFLLDRGFPASQTGLLLGTSNIISCMLQPSLGAMVDRSRKPILIPLLLGLMTLTAISYSIMLLADMPLFLFVIFYFMASLSFGSLTPLMNSITVCYRAPGDEIKFGVGRGVGSLSYGIFTLIMGYVILWAGIDAIMWLAISILVLLLWVTAGFLKHTPGIKAEAGREKSASISLLAFFGKYRRFSAALLGFVFISMFHSMIESYMIAIVEHLGGNSSNQGTALFIATISSVPMFLVIDRIRKKISVRGMLLIAGGFYILKAVLFVAAVSVAWIYAAQVLQVLTYAFYAPAQVYLADISVEAADKVKGQTICGASHTMGAAIGNVAGGLMLENMGVPFMLSAGVGMAVAGALILFFALQKD